MKPLEEIFAEQRTPDEIISDIGSRSKDIPSWKELRKQYEPKQHPIVSDPSLRPKEKNKNGQRDVPAKIAYPAEKIVTRRMVQMAFTIPVKRVYGGYDPKDEKAKSFADAIEKVYKANRINGVNKNRMRAYFAACEAATVWFVTETEEEHNTYGFSTNAKIRCRSYSQMDKKFSKIDEASIYPVYDDDGDMIALCFKYEVSSEGKSITHFDCFTAKKVYYYTSKDVGWDRVEKDNALGKIPAAYCSRPEPIYADIDDNRSEIEFANSRTSDVVKKNAAPIVVLRGTLVGGDAPTSESGREAYQVTGEGAGVDYLQSPMNVEQTTKHINTQKQMIAEITQLPDLSLENIKGLGAISGEARKTLLTDAHMKVGEEADEIIWFFDREFSVIKSLVASLNEEWKPYVNTLTCTHTITPFVQNDKAAQTDVLVKQVDGCLKSRRTAMTEMGDYDNVDNEMAIIEQEQAASAEANRMVDLFEGAE